MPEIISVRALRKSFGAVKAVDGISFSVEQGSLFAFLGLNGAGKSTTINILCSILPKDGGEVAIGGHDLDAEPQAVKELTGIVFQRTVLDDALTVEENLTVRAGFYGLYGAALRRRLDFLTETLALAPIFKRPFGKLSGGQRRRVDIARGLLHAPKLLFLDEPTTGLDPQTRAGVWKIIEDLRAETGMTVFLTTHYMEEAASADRVVILDGGRIAAEGTPHVLKNRYSGDFIRLYLPQSAEREALFTREGLEFQYLAEHYQLRVPASGAKAFLLAHTELLDDFEVVKGDMDDVFLSVTGKKLVGGEANA